jgi:hypothetical protein
MADKDEKKDANSGGTGMERPLLKRMLARSRKVAVSVAIGQGDAKSGGQGLLLLHHVMPPKQIMKALKTQFPTASKLCFGKASVDPEADPKLVTFRVNRRAPGLDRRLRKTLKGTGYSKVAIETGKAEEP